jgi:hypothetical protein
MSSPAPAVVGWILRTCVPPAELNEQPELGAIKVFAVVIVAAR